MAYKPSAYNLVVEEGADAVVLVNGISKAVVRLEAPLYRKLIGGELASLPEDTLVQLAARGFVVDEGIDELSLLKARHYRVRYDADIPSLHICPTLDCNFSCPYCFENPDYSGVFMSREIADRIVSHVERSAPRLKALGVRWFGGEPLLALETIEFIGSRILHTCERNGIVFHSNMATNGYCLDVEALRTLKRLKVERLQITLDGEREVHDRRRASKEAGSTFDVIVEHIGQAIDAGFHVVLRVNIDRETYPSMEAIFRLIDERGLDKQKLELFTWPTTHCGLREFDGHTASTFYTFEEYATRLEPQIIRMASQHGVLMYNHRTELGIRCPLYSVGSFYIDPLGYAYKCGFYLGMIDKAVGRFGQKGSLEITNPRRHLEPYSYDPFQTDECLACKALPYCYGKCPVIWEMHGRQPGAGCVVEKYTLVERVKNRIAAGKREDVRCG